MEGMDDKELMQAAMSDEAPPEPVTEQPAPEPAQESQPRDEHGRFAPKAAEPEEAPAAAQPTEQQPDPDQAATVPSWRLRELREEREAAAKRAAEVEAKWNEERQARARIEAQLQQLMAAQQPKQVPDMLSDPDGFVQHQQQTVQSAIDKVRFELSEDWARDKYGDDKVNSALQWMQQNLGPVEKTRITNARNPYREMVSLYDERQTLSQIGGDLNAYRSKVLDEALNDPTFMQKVADKLRGQSTPANGQRPVVSIPPSLNKAPGSHVGHDGNGSLNDADLYSYATR